MQDLYSIDEPEPWYIRRGAHKGALRSSYGAISHALHRSQAVLVTVFLCVTSIMQCNQTHCAECKYVDCINVHGLCAEELESCCSLPLR